MSASKLKGNLLEYIVRKLLLNCGFKKVQPDGVFIYKSRGLNMIQGKGASHDADVLMEPPIQMPFTYPYRINFECKAYKKKTGLPIVRNALGLRSDINDFELLDVNNLIQRRNNRRNSLQIYNRKRHHYQVGVASVDDFTKSALEFAVNNKIPLISLKWMFSSKICRLFNKITDSYLNAYNQDQLKEIMDFFKSDKFNNDLVRNDSVLNEILEETRKFEKNIVVGLLDTGDVIFLKNNNFQIDIHERLKRESSSINAKFYYDRNENDFWTVSLNDSIELDFYLPKSLLNIWGREQFSQSSAINLKEQYFSRLFIFVKDSKLPFRIINIDMDWLRELL